MPSLSPIRGHIALRSGSIEWPVKGTWLDLTSIVGIDIAIADGWWFSEHELCFVRYYHVYTVNLETGEITDWGPWQTNSLYSGGRVWAVGGPYHDTWGPNPYFDQSGWIPFAVDNQTGAIAVLTSDWTFCVYQGHLAPSEATLTPILSGVTEYQASFANGVLTLYSNGNWYHWTREQGLTYTGSLNRAQADAGGRWCRGWNLDGSANYGQVIWMDWQPQTAVSIGWVYNYNAKVWRESDSSPIVQVIGSKGPGELPGEQQVFTVDLDAHTLDGRPWTLVNLTQPPEPPDPPVPPIPPIPPQPPVEEDDMLPILDASVLKREHHHEFQDRYIYRGADDRFYTVTDEGTVVWLPKETDPNTLPATASFMWTSLAPTIYLAPRNGLYYKGTVNTAA